MDEKKKKELHVLEHWMAENRSANTIHACKSLHAVKPLAVLTRQNTIVENAILAHFYLFYWPLSEFN